MFKLTKVCKITFVVTCTSLTLSNGAVSYSNHSVGGGRYPVDTVATFSCNRGYSQSESSSRTCQTSGNWNQATPTCNQSKSKNIQSPKYINIYLQILQSN